MLEAEFGTADEIDESLLRLKQLLENKINGSDNK